MDALEGLNVAELREQIHILTPLLASTLTVQAHFSGLKFHEKYLIDFVRPEGIIKRIDCNFGHFVAEDYRSPKPQRKSNRGRKPQAPKPSTRKRQGDGTNFDSQIQFSIWGTHERELPADGKLPRHAVAFEKDGKAMIKVSKFYLLKVFRNGKIIIPGVLREDMSDIIPILNHLAQYLDNILNLENDPIALTRCFPTMCNFKLEIKGARDPIAPVKINLRELLKYSNRHFYTLLNTKFEDIVELLLSPIFSEVDLSPRDGWNRFAKGWTNYSMPPVNTARSLILLQDKDTSKNLYVNADRLAEILQREEFKQLYIFFVRYIQSSKIKMNDFVLQKILYYLMHEQIAKLSRSLNNHDDNKLSYIRYDPQRYNGFIIKVKTPAPDKPTKKTTIKIFSSGRINIDGANNREEAELISLWLNNLFVTNPQLLYRKNEQVTDDPDPEFPDEDPELPDIEDD